MRAAIKDACGRWRRHLLSKTVGGKVLEAVMPLDETARAHPGVRHDLVVQRAGGLGAGASVAKLSAPAIWRTILVNFLSVNGFIISNHWGDFPKFAAGKSAPKWPPATSRSSRTSR